MVGLEGVEPPTNGFRETAALIHLSYRPRTIRLLRFYWLTHSRLKQLHSHIYLAVSCILIVKG